jgi:hypothetical protein
LPVGAIFLSFSWYGKCRAGHLVDEHGTCD